MALLIAGALRGAEAPDVDAHQTWPASYALLDGDSDGGFRSAVRPPPPNHHPLPPPRLPAERFQRQVRAAAKLQHSNIVAAYDADQSGRQSFLVRIQIVDAREVLATASGLMNGHSSAESTSTAGESADDQ